MNTINAEPTKGWHTCWQYDAEYCMTTMRHAMRIEYAFKEQEAPQWTSCFFISGSVLFIGGAYHE